MSIISNEQVIKVLRQYNPWWRNPLAIKEESKPGKRVAYYEAIKMMMHKSIRRFVVLSGARRVGKTTIMYQMIEKLIDDGVNPQNILYVSFDNPMVKLVNVDTVLSIYESLYPIEGTRYIFFDEIQYTKHWELWMKVIYDNRKDIRLTATGSASPIIEKGAADSGTGRWGVLKIPTMSFYEYCKLLEIEEPILPKNLKLTNLVNMNKAELGDLMSRFENLKGHFNRYLTIGGFPELVLADDDMYAQRMLREDVVDKVIKRDVLTLFNIRNPILMEKLFLYLCMNSTEMFNVTTAAKELENTSVSTIDNYIKALEMSNLIYLSKPVDVGSKGSLKGKPKIFIADAAIRNAVLMVDDVLADEKELGAMVETAVYKHMVSFYQGSPAQLGYFRKAKDNQKEVDVVIELPREKILCEVKYRNNSHIPKSDAIVELCNDDKSKVTNAFLVTKGLDDFGIAKHETKVLILRIPAIAFLYILGKIEADGQNGRM
ncbi:ATP-binding protein [Clostridium cochlearium]|uniref:ATP-binding protein n=1 Tax=Clostridium cochlearium TaxID=1494 RepID=UPI001EDFF857|nr:ATP-binding protein [Clostridium cochlearium]MBV1820708.1 ATP-binding protein [Bacteroidales bacterium MSK.15.36]MCG4581010.1 ATP-binding protein [Clostridium cochlearium]